MVKDVACCLVLNCGKLTSNRFCTLGRKEGQTRFEIPNQTSWKFEIFVTSISKSSRPRLKLNVRTLVNVQYDGSKCGTWRQMSVSKYKHLFPDCCMQSLCKTVSNNKTHSFFSRTTTRFTFTNCFTVVDCSSVQLQLLYFFKRKSWVFTHF